MLKPKDKEVDITYPEHLNTIFAAGELGEGKPNPRNYSEGEIL